jgi:hypothetical protein
VLIKDFLNEQWREQRDGMPDGTLFPRRGHHDDLADLLQFHPQSTQPRSIDPIVIGK